MPLIARYPDFYRGSPEFKSLQDALEPEIQALWERRDSVMNQLSPETATWGLRYWEQTLGIPVEMEKDLDFRRSRVCSKMRGSGVTTVAMIQNVSESFSNGAVDVTEYPKQFRLEIKFIGTHGVPPNMDDLTQTLREIMPAHLQWDYVLVYNTWAVAGTLTWNQAGTMTWRQLRERDLND